MKNRLIIAEKPSVARDIARVVGANQSAQGYIFGNQYLVTWALGHLVTLPQPHEIRTEWKAWRRENLPMLPDEWPLQVVPRTKPQFKVIQGLIKKCDEVICATDAGREGELIFRYIYEATRCKKPVKRLWISSLTPDAIQDGMNRLQDIRQYDSLADAARARSRADWLIGMNLSRAYALAFNEKFFVGRVQTPTLAMIVKRDLEIRNFKPENYFEIAGRFTHPSSAPASSQNTYLGVYVGESREFLSKGIKPSKEKRFPPDLVVVQKVVDRIQSGVASIHSADANQVKQPPPLLYDLTELQRHANRIFGMSASTTLEIAQALYEKHKLISYPRTDSPFLSQSVANTLGPIVSSIRAPYEEHLSEGTGVRPIGTRFVNDAQVTDHHAIIPTQTSAARMRLTSDEHKIYDLICRRLLSTWQENYITEVTTVFTQVESRRESQAESNGESQGKIQGKIQGELQDSRGDGSLQSAHLAAHPDEIHQDLFRTVGTSIVKMGWKNLEVKPSWKGAQSDEVILPSGLRKGISVGITEIKAEAKKTKAPPHLTEAALLTAMETAGKTLDDRELAAAMKETGLGTPATRAGIIETLLSRGYIERKGKLLEATDFGIRLIETVHTTVKSPELTARWEKQLSQIQKGQQTLQGFMTALGQELKERTHEVLSSPLNESRSSGVYPNSNSGSRSPEVRNAYSKGQDAETSSSGNHHSQQSLNSSQELQHHEKDLSEHILKYLSVHGSRPAGRLFEEINQAHPSVNRKEFERILFKLNSLGGVKIKEETFQKNGKSITYRKISLEQKQ